MAWMASSELGEAVPVLPPPGTYPIVSSDGRWLWEGRTWVPHVSVDSTLVAPTLRTVQPVTPAMIVGGVIWLLLLVAWAPALYIIADTGRFATMGWPVGLSLGSAAIIATVMFGGYLGSCRRRVGEILMVSVIGSAALLSLYVTAMLAQPDTAQSDDTAAAAGLVIFGVPLLLIVSGLLGAGAVAGRVIANRRATTPGS
jgi:hypothetical protein